MLKLILLIIVGVLALSFFGITLQSIVNSPAGQANFAYVGQVVVSTWDSILAFFNGLVQNALHHA